MESETRGHGRRIELIQPLTQSRSAIWAAIATPAGMQGWQADAVEGKVTRGSTLILDYGGLDARVAVTVVAVDRERRLVLGMGRTRVAFVVHDGAVELTCTGLRDGDEAEGTTAAWRTSLGLLAFALAHHLGAPRRTFWSKACAPVAAETAHTFFTEPRALSTWLTRSGAIGSVGTTVDLELAWGERLQGTVLANTPGRDLAVSWTNRGQSVLVLRSLPWDGATSRLLAASWSCWNATPEPATCERLGAALTQLARHLTPVRNA